MRTSGTPTEGYGLHSLHVIKERYLTVISVAVQTGRAH